MMMPLSSPFLASKAVASGRAASMPLLTLVLLLWLTIILGSSTATTSTVSSTTTPATTAAVPTPITIRAQTTTTSKSAAASALDGLSTKTMLSRGVTSTTRTISFVHPHRHRQRQQLTPVSGRQNECTGQRQRRRKHQRNPRKRPFVDEHVVGGQREPADLLCVVRRGSTTTATTSLWISKQGATESSGNNKDDGDEQEESGDKEDELERPSTSLFSGGVGGGSSRDIVAGGGNFNPFNYDASKVSGGMSTTAPSVTTSTHRRISLRDTKMKEITTKLLEIVQTSKVATATTALRRDASSSSWEERVEKILEDNREFLLEPLEDGVTVNDPESIYTVQMSRSERYDAYDRFVTNRIDNAKNTSVRVVLQLMKDFVMISSSE